VAIEASAQEASGNEPEIQANDEGAPAEQDLLRAGLERELHQSYLTVWKGMKTGQIAPTVRAVKEAARTGHERAKTFLEQLSKDGLIEPRTSGRGWQLKAAR
jgi:hypothetical protein